MRIEILVATYNGERYLSEQLNSIREQTHANYKVLISDDGSTDGTCEIIDQFCSIDSRFRLIDRARKGGVVENFGYLIRKSSAEVIFLADQDDVWEKNKIEYLLCAGEDIGGRYWSEKELMLFGDMKVIGAEGELIERSFYKYISANWENNIDMDILRCCCTVYGASVMVTQRLLRKYPSLSADICMHDHFLALMAAKSNCLRYYSNTVTQYRVHDQNTVGARRSRLRLEWLLVAGVIKKCVAYGKKMKAQEHKFVEWMSKYKEQDTEEAVVKLDRLDFWIKQSRKVGLSKKILLLLSGFLSMPTTSGDS